MFREISLFNSNNEKAFFEILRQTELRIKTPQRYSCRKEHNFGVKFIDKYIYIYKYNLDILQLFFNKKFLYRRHYYKKSNPFSELWLYTYVLLQYYFVPEIFEDEYIIDLSNRVLLLLNCFKEKINNDSSTF